MATFSIILNDTHVSYLFDSLTASSSVLVVLSENCYMEAIFPRASFGGSFIWLLIVPRGTAMSPRLSAVARSLIPAPFSAYKDAVMNAWVEWLRRECAHHLGWWNPVVISSSQPPNQRPSYCPVPPVNAKKRPGGRPAPLFSNALRPQPLSTIVAAVLCRAFMFVKPPGCSCYGQPIRGP
jgi:hypothetical protein